ncbi:hypothetical protein [Saccharomonospora xinjiangensis]|uniref:Uncharacterized protein n=1 Tax=Saccharomonospora xinjiangensis XJ-54 TaxID=882086 RepID=I0UY96_9PSEU|nr:hypothetical protein [Saccharomonospora xinjiangensis]EID52849.1 hypothetical protein SacxiDRAFT_0577 [Saccharomonospora xinjiangensis XJ-54]
MSVWRRIFGSPIPEEIRTRLSEGEHVLAATGTADGGPVAVTALGLWVPEAGGARRIGWDLISKAGWSGDALTVVEAEIADRAGEAVVLRDLPPVRHVLPKPGRIPYLVRQRVEGSIRSRYRKELPGGGAWFVVRKLPGTDGVVLQVRPDSGTEPGVVRGIAEEAAAKLADGRGLAD